jgi:acyl-[acyl-carrier-protein]-phospholipid O-acyltransferase/long-chain-fatty-acid--[acyl-carrier-protein] ligase
VLTYGNIGSNIEAIDQVIHVRRPDVILGILPFFHTFGYTVTLWAEIVLDLEAAYHVNPLEAQAVGRLIRERKATIILATPMFLRNYARRCEPADFASAEIVITGGEHLPVQVADEFETKFGIRPLEGYGCTETSPLIAANIPPSRATQEQTTSAREGTVGKVAPGIRVKIVDHETGEELPAGSRGILLATGPNIMAGYLDQPEATAKAIRDGWYVTGDFATIDEDGFIRIVGRESRFAKIGGEMISHIAVEEALIDIVGTNEDGSPKLIVVSVADEARGERLVVIHTGLNESPDELRRKLADNGLPNLYIPGTNSYLQIEKLPMIGTGKIDLRQIREIANNAFAAKALSPSA